MATENRMNGGPEICTDGYVENLSIEAVICLADSSRSLLQLSCFGLLPLNPISHALEPPT